MDLNDSYKYDQHYRLLDLANDEEVGGIVKQILRYNEVYQELASQIMKGHTKEIGLANAKQYLVDNYFWKKVE